MVHFGPHSVKHAVISKRWVLNDIRALFLYTYVGLPVKKTIRWKGHIFALKALCPTKWAHVCMYRMHQMHSAVWTVCLFQQDLRMHEIGIALMCRLYPAYQDKVAVPKTSNKTYRSFSSICQFLPMCCYIVVPIHLHILGTYGFWVS